MLMHHVFVNKEEVFKVVVSMHHVFINVEAV